MQVSGIELKFDPSKEVGSRIVSLQKDGRDIGDDDKLTLVLTDYLAQGGDGYTIFKDLPYEVIGDLSNAVMKYFEDIGPITESTIKMGRQTQVRASSEESPPADLKDRSGFASS